MTLLAYTFSLLLAPPAVAPLSSLSTSSGCSCSIPYAVAVGSAPPGSCTYLVPSAPSVHCCLHVPQRTTYLGRCGFSREPPPLAPSLPATYSRGSLSVLHHGSLSTHVLLVARERRRRDTTHLEHPSSSVGSTSSHESHSKWLPMMLLRPQRSINSGFSPHGDENLRAALSKMGVGGRSMDDVMDKVRNRHYQLACTLTFEAIHASSCDAGINHPNQYFTDSQKILQSKKDPAV